jgi:hypothetical protein
MLDGHGFHTYRHPEFLEYLRAVDLGDLKASLEL